MSKQISKEEELYLKLIVSDFKNFLYMTWGHLKLPDPTEIQYDIADWLQGEESGNRRMIQAYRGIGKTFITSAYICWRLLRDPDEKFIIVSAGQNFAEEISKFVKSLLETMPILAHLKPSLTDNNSVTTFNVAGRTKQDKSPTVKVAGIGGQITGSRATEIIADDIEVEKNSKTQLMRTNLINAIKEFTNILVPGGKITYLGTPQTEETIYKHIGENFKIRIWPARYPRLKSIGNYAGNLAPIIIDRLTKDPSLEWKPTNNKQHHDEDLIERELTNGRSSFLLQYMLDTSLSDATRYPLKLSDLIVYDLNTIKAPINIAYGRSRDLIRQDLPNVGFTGDSYYSPIFVDDKWDNYDGSVMSIDPSGRGSDETGYAIVKKLNGTLFVIDAGAIEGGYEDSTLEKLSNIANEHKVNKVIIESNFGDGLFTKMFSSVLRKIYPCSVEEIRSFAQKEKRIIDTLEPIMNRHKLVFNASIIIKDNETEDKNKNLMYQLTRITKDRGSLKHDDRLDALAMAIAFWIEAMGQDKDEAISQYHQEQFNKEVERFIETQVLSIHRDDDNLSFID